MAPVDPEDVAGEQPVDDERHTESTPLLAESRERVKPTPLPIAQLLILTTVRLAEPISFSQIFPYINQMIEYLGIAAPQDVGYYSGMVDSAFSLVQALTIYFWSSLSNKIGRKPVIIIGVLGATLSSACFGLSRSLPALMISRCLAGALSGNVAVMSTMLTELTDETNQARAFPLMGATWYIGSMIGPILGGTLSNPADKWPTGIGRFELFKQYPYLLPCLVSSALSLTSVLLCSLMLHETLPSIVAKKKQKAAMAEHSESESETPTAAPSGSSSPTSTASTVEGAPAEQETTGKKKSDFWILIKNRQIQALLFGGFIFHFLGVAFDVVFVLFSYTKIKLGGMERSPSQIGYALAISGAFGTFMSLVFFPFISKKFNNRNLYVFFSAFWAMSYAVMPLGHLAATAPLEEGKKDVLVWFVIGIILLPIRLAVMVAPLGMIIVRASVESSEQLGTLFGLQQAFFSIGRGISPAFSSTLFAYSVEKQIWGGNLVWAVMFGIGLIGVPLAMRVKDVKAGGKTR